MALEKSLDSYFYPICFYLYSSSYLWNYVSFYSMCALEFTFLPEKIFKLSIYSILSWNNVSHGIFSFNHIYYSGKESKIYEINPEFWHFGILLLLSSKGIILNFIFEKKSIFFPVSSLSDNRNAWNFTKLNRCCDKC